MTMNCLFTLTLVFELSATLTSVSGRVARSLDSGCEAYFIEGAMQTVTVGGRCNEGYIDWSRPYQWVQLEFNREDPYAVCVGGMYEQGATTGLQDITDPSDPVTLDIPQLDQNTCVDVPDGGELILKYSSYQEASAAYFDSFPFSVSDLH